MIKGLTMPTNSNHSAMSEMLASRCHSWINALYIFIDHSKSTGNSKLQNRYSVPLPAHIEYSCDDDHSTNVWI